MYEVFVSVVPRKKWLQGDIEITKETKNKSVRGLWSDGKTRLSVDFYTKGEIKSQVVIQHLKITDSGTAEKLKAMWSERLVKLKSQMEDK